MFHNDKSKVDGKCSACKSCNDVKAIIYRKENAEAILKRGNEWRANNRGMSNATARRRLSENSDARLKQREASKVWAKRNRATINASNRERRRNNHEKYRAYDKTRAAQHAAIQATRRSAKINATVQWYDKDKVNQLYMAAKVFTFFNPFGKHEVDHIVPLKNKKVCGLHIHVNLQILTRYENQRKGNKLCHV